MSKQPKLNPKQLAIMAAILGMSNAGSDHLFRGHQASVKPIDAMDFYTAKSYGDDLQSAVVRFGNGIFENEEMLDMFVDECRSWVKKLKAMPIDKIKATWSDYASFVDAIS